MVNRETYQADIEAVRQILRTATLVRAESGGWTLVIEVDGEISIDDTRTLRVASEVRIRGQQRGRKRHNNLSGGQFKRKKPAR